MTASMPTGQFMSDAMSIEKLTQIASLPGGRRALEEWRETHRARRDQLCDLQVDDKDGYDELLRRLDLALDGGIHA